MNNLKLNENMQFVMMETTAFEEIINQVIATVKTKMKAQPSDWIDENESKKLLGISSKSTMQRFRDEDRIRYAMVTNKNIMYSRKSILKYLETKSNKQYA